MTETTKHAGSEALVRIEGEMTIYRASELKQLLLAQIETSAAVDIDLADVTEFDTAGVQLLILACRTAQRMGRKLRLVAQSPAVAEVLGLLGVASHFGGSCTGPSVCAEPLPSNP